VFSGVKTGRQRAEKRGMTPEQMEYRAQQAEHLLERYSELERERETAGLYEEALEARRLRLEQEASVTYWRERLSDAA
jgi:ribonuclease D